MVKKMVKYSKFVLCIALILSLVAPSYAALSASDGSAFVTKAEFDSALADFNARLTTFEAGINSKIDSQVTSYLDRNGIWNGKKQVLKNENGVFQSTLADFSSFEAKQDIKEYTSYINPGSASACWGEAGISSPHNAIRACSVKWRSSPTDCTCLFTVCDNITKSGLISATLNSRLAYDSFTAATQSTKHGYKTRGQTTINWADLMLNSDEPPTFEDTVNKYTAVDGQCQIGVVWTYNAVPQYMMSTEASGFFCRGDLLIYHGSDPARIGYSWYVWNLPYAALAHGYRDNRVVIAPLNNGPNISAMSCFASKDDKISVRYTIQGYGRASNYNDTWFDHGQNGSNGGNSDSWLSWWTAFKDFQVY